MLNVKDFDEYLVKWFEAKKNRYNIVTKNGGGYLIYDYTIYDLVKKEFGNGEMLEFEDEKDAKEWVQKKEKKWREYLIKKMEERIQNPNIWDPIFS